MNSILVTDAAPSVIQIKPALKRPFCFFCTDTGAAGQWQPQDRKARGSSSPRPWGLRGRQQRDAGLGTPTPDPTFPKAAPLWVRPRRPAPHTLCPHGPPLEEASELQTSVPLAYAPAQNTGSWDPQGLGLDTLPTRAIGAAVCALWHQAEPPRLRCSWGP